MYSDGVNFMVRELFLNDLKFIRTHYRLENNIPVCYLFTPLLSILGTVRMALLVSGEMGQEGGCQPLAQCSLFHVGLPGKQMVPPELIPALSPSATCSPSSLQAEWVLDKATTMANGCH